MPGLRSKNDDMNNVYLVGGLNHWLVMVDMKMVILWLMMVNNLVGGWALPLWKMMDFVSWDDDIPNSSQYMESHKSRVPNHQPEQY